MNEPLTPSRLWKKMTPDLRLRAARAFWLDDEAANDQLQAVMLISQKKNEPEWLLEFRLKAFRQCSR